MFAVLIASGVLGILLGLIALLKGSVKTFKINNRKQALIALAVSIILISIGANIAPEQTNEAKFTQDMIREMKMQNEKALQAFCSYLENNFQTTLWYNSIKEISISGSNIKIKTDIYPDEEGKKIAQYIKTACLFFIKNKENEKFGLESVEIWGKQDRLLASYHEF